VKGLNGNGSKGSKELLYKMADDVLILGHRNSEWTGLGPILEEDIAFSSMAQDKLGHAQALYELLNQMGEADKDSLAFGREVENFKCCHLVEYPIGEYEFSLMRHFLFDVSEAIRFDLLAGSSFEPLANLAKKFRGELKYHTMHADTWIVQLGNSSSDAKSRLQKALELCFPLALGIFEKSEFENEIIEEIIFPGEEFLRDKWYGTVGQILSNTDLILPDMNGVIPVYGGRKGNHTEYLKPLLDEMSEVYSIDPEAEW